MKSKPWRLALAGPILALLALTCPLPAASADTWTPLSKPIDPAQFSLLPWGTKSHWLQPWRSYLDTVPAADFRDAVGINFNVTATEAPATARLLGQSGFKRARYEIPWNAITYDDPTKFNNEPWLRKELTALRDNGLRPLILLNANDGGPTPSRAFTATLTAPAAAGARTIALNPASAAQVAPGFTGLNINRQAGVLLTSVDANGVATLSRPLPAALPVGATAGATLRNEPFALPLLSNGQPNPRFEQTLAGWLSYVKTVLGLVKSVLGSDAFDVEVWNELGFASGFLSNSNYYSPVPEAGSGIVTDEILKRTIAFIRNPANGFANVGIGNGFANQSPWPAGSTSPLGLTAIDKHPYAGQMLYPLLNVPGGNQPVNALGEADYTLALNSAGAQVYKDKFVPSYREFMPEHFFTGLQTETLIRDLSPTDSAIGGVFHGRNTHPLGGSPPQLWITEYGLNAQLAQNKFNPQLTDDEVEHVRAKSTLRFLIAYANKGAKLASVFAAKGGLDWGNIPKSWFDAVNAGGGAYPTTDPGPVMPAVGRMMATMSGPDLIAQPRSLTLDGVADNHNHVQFAGDGTPGHPALYNRDVLAFFPFQVSNHRFVAGVYVMTRSVEDQYRTDLPAGDWRRADLPDEAFRLTVGGVDGANVTLSYTDPLTGQNSAATVVQRTANSVVVQVSASDSPRMLTIDDSPPPPAAPKLTAPADNTWFKTSTITLTGTAEPGATVEILDLTTSLATTTATALGTWSRQLTGLADGAHWFNARATNMSGASPASAIKVLLIDTLVPPIPTFATPAAGSTIPPTFSITGTAERGTLVELFEDGVSRGSLATGTGNWSRNLSNVTSGWHSFTVRTADLAGNVSPISAPFMLRVNS